MDQIDPTADSTQPAPTTDAAVPLAAVEPDAAADDTALDGFEQDLDDVAAALDALDDDDLAGAEATAAAIVERRVVSDVADAADHRAP